MSNPQTHKESLLPTTSLLSVFLWLATCALVILGLVTLESILKPLVLAFYSWIIINQLKRKIQNLKIAGRRFSEKVSIAIALVIVVSVLAFITELLIANLVSIARTIPDYHFDIVSSLGSSDLYTNNSEMLNQSFMKFKEANVEGLGQSVLGFLSGSITNLVLVIIYVIFFLLEDQINKTKVGELFPSQGSRYHNFRRIVGRINASVSSYIWSKTIISLLTAVGSLIFLVAFGVKHAFLWSFIIFIFNFIPYLGPLISSLLPSLFIVLQTGDTVNFIYVFAVLEAIQILIANLIEPRVVGKGTNLSPVVVIISLSFWGTLWGVTGMALAVPLTATIVIILSHYRKTKFVAILLSQKGDS